MRFLADEYCDFLVVRTLRAAGHDVVTIGESEQRSIDRDLLQRALQDDRILLTEDKDFGWLVFAGRLDSPGVVLIRYPSSMRASLGDDVLGLVGNHGSKLIGNFVVLKPGSLRISPKLRSS